MLKFLRKKEKIPDKKRKLSEKERIKEINKIESVLDEIESLNQKSFAHLFNSIIQIYPNPKISNEEVSKYEHLLGSSLIIYLFSLVEEKLNYNKKEYFKNIKNINKKLSAFKHIRHVCAHSIGGNRFENNKEIGFYKEFNEVMKSENKILGVSYYNKNKILIRVGIALELREFLSEILKLKIKELKAS